MHSYYFDAPPRVVKNKPKYKKEPEPPDAHLVGMNYQIRNNEKHLVGSNIAKKTESPQDLEDLKVAEERETKKVEMLKEQLIKFKKEKQTPYELSPQALPRIEVDLTFFLTEQNAEASTVKDEETHADLFNTQPIEQKYLPKKGGIDATTQIWDYDLFSFDGEVEPILSVLVEKTLEQSMLEVDEETEVRMIRKYKGEYGQRRKMEKDDWSRMVEEEVKRVKAKNKKLNEGRETHKRIEGAIQKVQCLHLAKHYLRGILAHSLQFYVNKGSWRDLRSDAFKNFIDADVLPSAYTKIQGKGVIREHWNTMLAKGIENITKLKKPVEERHRAVVAKREKMRMIDNKESRRVRLMFVNLQGERMSSFSMNLSQKLEGRHKEQESEMKRRYGEIYSKYENGEEDWEEMAQQYNEQVLLMTTQLRLQLKGIPQLSFGVATDPHYKLLPQQELYTPEAWVYLHNGTMHSLLSMGGEEKVDVRVREKKEVLTGEIEEGEEGEGEGEGLPEDSQKIGEEQALLEETTLQLNLTSLYSTQGGLYDKRLRVNDSEKLVFNMKKVPEEVGMILLIGRERPGKLYTESLHKNGVYRIFDESTNQTVDSLTFKEMRENAITYVPPVEGEAGENIERVEGEERPSTWLFIAGRVNRRQGGWEYEALNQCVEVKSPSPMDEVYRSLGELYTAQPPKLIRTEEWLEGGERGPPSQSASKIAIGKSLVDKSKGKLPEASRAGGVSGSSGLDVGGGEYVCKGVFEDDILRFKQHSIGPILFDCINTSGEQLTQQIFDYMKIHHTELYEECIHGLEIYLNNRLLKDGKQILAHSRYLTKFIIKPLAPMIIEEEEKEVLEGEEGEGVDAEEEDDE